MPEKEDEIKKDFNFAYDIFFAMLSNIEDFLKRDYSIRELESGAKVSPEDLPFVEFWKNCRLVASMLNDIGKNIDNFSKNLLENSAKINSRIDDLLDLIKTLRTGKLGNKENFAKKSIANTIYYLNNIKEDVEQMLSENYYPAFIEDFALNKFKSNPDLKPAQVADEFIKLHAKGFEDFLSKKLPAIVKEKYAKETAEFERSAKQLKEEFLRGLTEEGILLDDPASDNVRKLIMKMPMKFTCAGLSIYEEGEVTVDFVQNYIKQSYYADGKYPFAAMVKGTAFHELSHALSKAINANTRVLKEDRAMRGEESFATGTEDMLLKHFSLPTSASDWYSERKKDVIGLGELRMKVRYFLGSVYPHAQTLKLKHIENRVIGLLAVYAFEPSSGWGVEFYGNPMPKEEIQRVIWSALYYTPRFAEDFVISRLKNTNLSNEQIADEFVSTHGAAFNAYLKHLVGVEIPFGDYDGDIAKLESEKEEMKRIFVEVMKAEGVLGDDPTSKDVEKKLLDLGIEFTRTGGGHGDRATPEGKEFVEIDWLQTYKFINDFPKKNLSFYLLAKGTVFHEIAHKLSKFTKAVTKYQEPSGRYTNAEESFAQGCSALVMRHLKEKDDYTDYYKEKEKEILGLGSLRERARSIYGLIYQKTIGKHEPLGTRSKYILYIYMPLTPGFGTHIEAYANPLSKEEIKKLVKQGMST